MAGTTPTQVMQGIEVPASSVNPDESILQTGIISGLMIQFSGQVVVTLGGGTCATTGRWPYDLVRAARFSANGQSNLINCHGSVLKAREIMARGDLTDRGVIRGVGGASP